MKYFVNFTSHPYSGWSDKQIAAAGAYGTIVDLPFPAISTEATNDELICLADNYLRRIINLSPSCVLCQGEMVFTFLMVGKLMSCGIPVVCAVSKRKTIETVNDKGMIIKTIVFEFEGFRKYIV